MGNTRGLVGFGLVLLLAGLGACDEGEGRGGPDGLAAGRADQESVPPGTCEASCGAQAVAGCWCDDQCEGYGDCCADFAPVCLDDEVTEPAADDAGDGDGDGTPAPGDVSAQALLDLTADCKRLPGSELFRTDAGKSGTIEICQLEGAIWWRADADIDCDGGKSSPCTEDPWYQAETSSKDSEGNFIDSAKVPHFVVPLPGYGFFPKDHGIKTGWSGYGSAGAIIYDGKLLYAPYADAGPKGVVGELSAAAADLLGIPNSPVSGGVEAGVTYIVFTGPNTYVDPIESRDAAESLGADLAAALLANN
jgi:hypothetical protein